MPFVFDWIALVIFLTGIVASWRANTKRDTASIVFHVCMIWACVRLAAPTIWWVAS